MKRLFVAIVLCAGLISAAAAQLSMSGVGGGFGGGSSPAVTVSGATTDVKNCSFGASCTSNAVTVPTGFVVFGIGGQNQGTAGNTVSSVVANSPCSGSISAVENPGVGVTGGAGNHFAALFAGTVTGGSCTITVTFSQGFSMGVFGIALEALTNLLSTTAGTPCTNQYNNGGSPSPPPYACSSGITIASSGIAIAVLSSSSIGALASTNLTIDAQSGSTLGIGIAHSSAAGSITPVFTTGSAFDISSLSAAPWR